MQTLVAPFEKTLGELLFQQQQLGEPIPVPLTLAILRQVCDALDYAHNLRDGNGNPMYILHRDVSPGHILVGQQGATRLIASMAIQANPSYVAPEILLGMVPDPRADLFSLGVVAHEMLTGRPLFLGANEHDTLARVCQLPIPPPTTINPAVTYDIEGVVLTALARDPGYRWQSAAMMRDGLASAAARNGLDMIPEGAWAALFQGHPMPRSRPMHYAAPAQPQPPYPQHPQEVPIVPAPIAAQPTVVAPPPLPLSALPTVIAPSPNTAAPTVVAPLPAVAATPAVAVPPAIPTLPRPKSSTKSSNVASAKTPAPVITQPLPSPPQRAHNPAAKTPTPVVMPTLPKPSANMFDDAPATMASVPAFDSNPPSDDPGPKARAFDAPPANVFDDGPATMALPRPLAAPPANAFDDAPATSASLPAFSPPSPTAFDDSPATIARERPAYDPARNSREDLPAPRAKPPSRQDLPPLTKPVEDLPAPRAKQPSQTLPARAKQPSQPQPRNQSSDLPAPRASKPPSQEVPHVRKELGVDDLPAPRALRGSKSASPFEDLPAPKPKARDDESSPIQNPRPKADPENPLFADLPAPRAPKADPKHALFTDLPAPRAPKVDPGNPLFTDLPAPRASKPSTPPARGLSNFDDDVPAPPAPVGPRGRQQPRASTADVDGFLASVANDQASGLTGDPEIDAYVAGVVGDAELPALSYPPSRSEPAPPTAYEPPAPPAEPASYAQAPPEPKNPFELDLGEFTNIGAAPLISFTGETPMVVAVGPKPAPPRTAAPSLPPPVAMISANRVADPEDEEPSSKHKLVMIVLGALLVISFAVIAFLILSD